MNDIYIYIPHQVCIYICMYIYMHTCCAQRREACASFTAPAVQASECRASVRAVPEGS